MVRIQAFRCLKGIVHLSLHFFCNGPLPAQEQLHPLAVRWPLKSADSTGPIVFHDTLFFFFLQLFFCQPLSRTHEIKCVWYIYEVVSINPIEDTEFDRWMDRVALGVIGNVWLWRLRPCEPGKRTGRKGQMLWVVGRNTLMHQWMSGLNLLHSQMLYHAWRGEK